MGALIVIGIIWLIVALCKDACITNVPDGTDFNATYKDAHKLSKKEYTRRLDSGYYVKKDK